MKEVLAKKLSNFDNDSQSLTIQVSDVNDPPTVSLANRLVTISEITNAYDVSENHVMKIVPQLAKKGYLETVRGKSGGIRLSRPPHMINVGQVVRDTEENMDLVECFDSSDSNCPMLPGCILKSVLIEARKSFLETLSLSVIGFTDKPLRFSSPGASAHKEAKRRRAALNHEWHGIQLGRVTKPHHQIISVSLRTCNTNLCRCSRTEGQVIGLDPVAEDHAALRHQRARSICCRASPFHRPARSMTFDLRDVVDLRR